MPDIDKDAIRFLLEDIRDEQKKQGVSIGIAISESRHAKEESTKCRKIAEDCFKEVIANNLRLERYGDRLRAVEARLDMNGGHGGAASGGMQQVAGHSLMRPPLESAPDPMEITANRRSEELAVAKELVELRVKLSEREDDIEELRKEKRDSGIWWKRQRFLWIGVVVAGLILASCTAAGAYIANRILPPPTPIAK